MGKSRHIQARMSQRGITEDLVDLTLRFGVPQHDGKVVLNRKGIRALLRELVALNRTAQKALNKGGIVVVECGDTLITTYDLKSYKRPQAANDARYE